MITDRNMRVSLAQDISQIVGTYVSTDSIDMASASGNEPIDIGSGMKIRAAFTIVAAVVGTVSTVQFQIITDSTADLAMFLTSHRYSAVGLPLIVRFIVSSNKMAARIRSPLNFSLVMILDRIW